MNKQIAQYAVRQAKNTYRFLLVLIASLTFTQSFGQEVPAFVYYSNLTPQTGFPKWLQSARSAVIIDLEEDWKTFSEKVHRKLRLMSVDAVQYVDYRDMNAGKDATKTILEYLKQRQITYLLTFTKNKSDQYELNITDLEGFLKPGTHVSYQYAGVELKGLLKYVANELIKADLEKSNFLVAEKPEFLEDVAAIKGRKFEVHARDLSTLKLAVPKFQKITKETIDTAIAKEPLLAYNRQVDAWNVELEQILKASFPYKYEMVASTDARELYKEGFQYALLNFHTKGVSIKKMLNMKTEDAETEYITSAANDVLERKAVTKVVFKFYVKHLYTNDIYTGDKWDAGDTWQEALRNYLYHYRKFVTRGKGK
ncbi:MAG: hypothetical protein AAFO69_01095 [Bacteroidota bacterium]